MFAYSFLIILGIMNLYILYKLVEQMRRLTQLPPGEEQKFEISGAGCFFYFFRKLFKLIDP